MRTSLPSTTCRPHSLESGFSHHQRPARTSSPGWMARVQGSQPIEGQPWSCSGLQGTSLARMQSHTSCSDQSARGLNFSMPWASSRSCTCSSARVTDCARRWPVTQEALPDRARFSGSILRMWQHSLRSSTLSQKALAPFFCTQVSTASGCGRQGATSQSQVSRMRSIMPTVSLCRRPVSRVKMLMLSCSLPRRIRSVSTMSSAARLEASAAGAYSAAMRSSVAWVLAMSSCKPGLAMGCPSLINMAVQSAAWAVSRLTRRNSGFFSSQEVWYFSEKSVRPLTASWMSLSARTAKASKPTRCMQNSWSRSTSPMARSSPVQPRRARRLQAMEQPRPSANLGKSTATTLKLSSSPLSSSGRSSLASQTPTSARALRVAAWAFHTVSGTITRPAGTVTVSADSPSARRSTLQSSLTTVLFLMISGIGVFSCDIVGRTDRRCVYEFLERVHTDAAHGIDEAFFFIALLDVDLQQAVDHGGHLGGRERGADDLADRGFVALGAAQRDLVPLGTILVHAQDADVAHVVVTAGIDAAGDVEFDVADVMLEVDVLELLGDGLGDRDRLGIGQRAEVAARAADDVGQQADVGGGQAVRLGGLPQRVQLGLLDVGQHQVLLVGHAQFAEAVLVGQVGHEVHLVGGDVARRHARLLQRQQHGGIARLLVGLDVALDPVGKTTVFGLQAFVLGIHRRQGSVGRIGEELRHALQFFLGQGGGTVLDLGPFLLDLAGKFLGADGLDQDLDARLVHVVAAAVLVVDAQDGFQVGHGVLPGQEVADDAAQDGRAAHAAADQHAEAHFAGFVLEHVQADVMHGSGGAVFGGAADGDLELARQVGELGVEGAPLADQFGIGTRIDDLVGGHASELVGGGVADAVARGLDGVHLDAGQFFQDLGGFFQLDPVELDVLAGGEVAIASVVLDGDLGELAQLLGSQHAVGDGDAQHVGMALQVETVLQAQDTEFVLDEFIRQAPAHLVPVLCDSLFDDQVIVLVIAVHLIVPVNVLMGDPNARCARLKNSLPNQLDCNARQRNGQQASQEFLRHRSCCERTDGDTRHRAQQQRGQQFPVDRTQPPVAQCRNGGQRHGVGDVGAGDLGRRQARIQQDQQGCADGTGTDGRNGHQRAQQGAGGDGGVGQCGALQLALRMRIEPGLHARAEQQGGHGQQHRDGDGIADGQGDAVTDGAEVLQQQGGRQGSRQGAIGQAAYHFPAHGTLETVGQGASGLGRRGKGQVGAHRHAGVDAEQQGQQGRHERAATDPGQSDQQSHGKSAYYIRNSHNTSPISLRIVINLCFKPNYIVFICLYTPLAYTNEAGDRPRGGVAALCGSEGFPS
eukprot:TRINITY_DN643_c0_g3_i1.p1 TRINITY_DN643_c0_g3~~TRINITY_DN643_c0_g3_i1.p1  ORF type:complete len:1321 (+),score=447.37 TRINITY_DN643_c0_g3_i1:3726-7688(+)